MSTWWTTIKTYSNLLAQLISISIELVRGILKIYHLRAPIVAIFGGARLEVRSPYAQQVYALTQLLGKDKISVITGGGPGVMEAANCGVLKGRGKRGHSIGVGVEGLDEGKFNVCVRENLTVRYFFQRKWLLMRYSVGFIIFPGGFGTLDELTEVLHLMELGELMPVPVVLIGVTYWQSLIDWFSSTAFKHHMIDTQVFSSITLTDDIEYAFKIIKNYCDSCARAHLQ